MAKIYYKGRDYSRAIGGSGGDGGSVDSTDIPTAGKVSEFDNNAHINSEDMSSQDIEDFLADINAQGTPSEYRKLLWSNPSPTADFAAQTISLDLSGYDEIEIEASHAPSLNTYCKVKVGNDAYMYASELSGSGTGYVQNVARKCTVGSSEIVFGSGYYNYGSNSSATVANSKLIPVYIYGIKYEKVAPIQIGYMPEFENPVDVVSSMINSPYWTCPADGIIVARAVSSGSATGIYIQDNTLNIQACGLYQNTMANNTQLTCTAPVLKGHIYKRNYYSGQGSGQVYYYKFK